MMPAPPPPTTKGRPPPITALLSEEAATAELARQSSVDSIDAADDPATAPPVPPRRKSSVKSLKLENNKENCSDVSDPKKRPKSDDYDSKRVSTYNAYYLNITFKLQHLINIQFNDLGVLFKYPNCFWLLLTCDLHF